MCEVVWSRVRETETVRKRMEMKGIEKESKQSSMNLDILYMDITKANLVKVCKVWVNFLCRCFINILVEIIDNYAIDREVVLLITN